MLTRYALERLLYRLSVSAWSKEFLLKGALLFDLWFDQPQRPTRDIDLLGFGPAGLYHLTTVFQEICGQACDDGMAYDQASVRATEIRKDANYEGVRVTLPGTLDGARCAIQVDVGYGAAVTPAADSVLFPVVLEDMPQPTLRAYPVYTVVAEKYQAMVSLGIANTRMKDYFDLWILVQHATIDRTILEEAIHATFLLRGTPIQVRINQVVVQADMLGMLSACFAQEVFSGLQRCTNPFAIRVKRIVVLSGAQKVCTNHC